MDDPRPDFWNFCAHCKREYRTVDAPPVVKLVSDGGEVTPVSFCSEDCKAAWTED